MAKISIDFNTAVKPVKPMHGIGQPPFYGINNSMFHYLTEAGIPYSRLHDVEQHMVDIPLVFPNFDADVNDPASYDFVFTDWLLTELKKAGVEPYYRLGITIENNADMKAYYTEPPKDFQKWAEICEHIIAHYNEGWANGFHYNITYWEIWNEPDGTVPGFPYKAELWNGTPEQFYELYDVAAKHLKSKFPNIKIGGYACTAFRGIFMKPEEYKGSREELFINFFHGFMKYIKEHHSPIDFFSWHAYNTVDKMIKLEKYLQEQLKFYGYEGLENHLNEWNPRHEERGSALHNAHVLSCMIAMQDANVSSMYIYDGRLGVSTYAALFNPFTRNPLPAYYGFVAFNQLYRLGTEVKTEITLEEGDVLGESDGIYALSATDGETKKTLVVNLSPKKQTLSFPGMDGFKNVWLIDEEHLLAWSPQISTLEPYRAMLIEW